MTPSEILQAAADRIRDLAAAATPGPWTVGDHGDSIIAPTVAATDKDDVAYDLMNEADAG